MQQASTNPPCAQGATDAWACRVMAGSVTNTQMVVQCSGSPEGAECGASYSGYSTRAKFAYIAVDSNCSVSQCRDGQDNDGDGLIDLTDPGCQGDPNSNDEGSEGSCLRQTFDSGIATVRFTNGSSHSSTFRVSLPASCQNPHIVAQSYQAWERCGTGAGAASCLNNASNIYTQLRAMVVNVSSNTFDTLLSADDTVYVGATSPEYSIAYQVTCDDPSGATVSCAQPIHGGTSNVRYFNGTQVSTSSHVGLQACQDPVVLSQSYTESLTCGNGSGSTACPNTPSSRSTDLMSILSQSPTAAGFSVALTADDPVWVGAVSPYFPVAHQTYCKDHPDPSGHIFGGTVDARFFNAQQNSTSTRVTFARACKDPVVVTQSYASSARCGNGSGATACSNNPANIYTYLKSHVSNVSSTGFDTFVSADDNVWVGASSPLFTIGYTVSCSSTQCADGLDNDSDHLVDERDPGCWTNPSDPSSYDPTRDNEGAATTQCQDSLDNDQDGVIDRTDPGCWALANDPNSHDPSLNNEAAATTQCQDTLDNDRDLLVDRRDPACWTDRNNPSSYDRTRNDESLATTQCQDGSDNDGDRLIDGNDPGCWSTAGNSASYDPTRDSEANGTTQCQDGSDNDGDGVIDARDPGCWTDPNSPSSYDPTRNDESSGTTQCQDRSDNDHDGLIDAQDPGCWTDPSNPATYDRTRNNESLATSQCQDGRDNDSDGNIDYPNDAGCSGPTDNNEGDDPLLAPTNLRASDNDSEAIVVTWTAMRGATSYELYRSEEPSETDPQLFRKIADSSTGIVGTTFRDTNAVPGRVYNYAVKAVNSSGTSGFSNVDAGLRPSGNGDGDCDGDGVSDQQEQIDGTGVCDGGSFVLHLKSPAFSKYNTFLNQWNFLELVATGAEPVSNILVTVYTIEGQARNTLRLSLATQTQFDVDINSLVGERDTYGVIRIDFNDRIVGSTLSGRITNYRPDPQANTYSFAFTRELRNATRGDTFGSTNSYDPQGMGFLVPNWVEVVNVSPVTQRFVYNLFNQSGQLVTTKTFDVPPLGERDVAGGHEQGQGVYLAEVRPLRGDAEYFSYVSRYSSNTRGGSEADTYNYAFSLENRAGNGTTQYTPASNEVGGCFSQTNWVEVTNVRSLPVTAYVTFRNEAGEILGGDHTTLNPKAQFHFNAGALLERGAIGSVKIDSDRAGSLLAQSLVYYHDCSQNRVQTAYATQSRIPGQDVQIGTANSFLGMENSLRMINSSIVDVGADITIRPFGSAPLVPQHYSLRGSSILGLRVNGLNANFNFPLNTYGTIRVQTTVSKQLIPQVLRVRPDPSRAGAVDFVIPTIVQ